MSKRSLTPVLRTVLWGEALDVKTSRAHRGLQGAVELIQTQVGKSIGSRNTFAKLFEATSPSELDRVEAWRAWLLLTAIGEEPSEWGLGHNNVPPAFDAVDVACRLRLARRSAIEAWGRRHLLPAAGESIRRYVPTPALALAYSASPAAGGNAPICVKAA